MEHWEYLKPDGLRFVWDDTLFRPGTDSFLLSSLPKFSAGLRVCDLGCGTGLLGPSPGSIFNRQLWRWQSGPPPKTA